MSQKEKGNTHTYLRTHWRQPDPLVENRAIKKRGPAQHRHTDRSREHLVIIPVDELPLAGLSYGPQPPFLSSLHPATNPSAANFIPGISPCLLVYLVIFLGGEMVEYRLLLLIIGTYWTGPGHACTSLITLSGPAQRRRKGDERESERTPQEVLWLLRQAYREVTAEKEWRWK